MELKEDAFDNDVYARNTTGFVTSHPVKWTIALEHYIASKESNSCRWRYKTDKVGKYTEASLILFYEMTRRLEIHIQYKTGVIKVTGETYIQWVTNEFPSVKDHFSTLTAPIEVVEETQRKRSSAPSIPTSQVTVSDIDLVWERLED